MTEPRPSESYNLDHIAFPDPPPGNANYILDSIDFETKIPLDFGKHSVELGAGLGKLDCLSNELLVTLLLSLDLPSLTTFRSVNTHAMAIVDSLHEYRMLVQHCPTLVRSIISLEAHAYGLRELFEALCSTKCRWCQTEFGSCLYLITGERTCQSCAGYLTNTPARPAEAAQMTGVPEDLVWQKYPSILSVPGKYGYALFESPSVATSRLRLMDNLAIRTRHSGNTTLVGPNSLRAEMVHVNDPNDSRFMALITAPKILGSPTEGHTVDWGYYCAGCRSLGRSVQCKRTAHEMIAHIADEGPVAWEKDDLRYDGEPMPAETMVSRGYTPQHYATS